MARPREFDEQEVLDKALKVFWTKGYEGTSVQDLVDATGLSRASLYGAFGDKQDLYQRVLDRYDEGTRVEEGLFDHAPSVCAGLEGLLRSYVDQIYPRTGPRGCFMVLAASTCEPGDRRTRDLARDRSEKLERLFERALRRGQSLGEIAADRDPVVSARFLLVMLQGMATVARSGWPRDRVEAIVTETLSTILGPPKTSTRPPAPRKEADRPPK